MFENKKSMKGYLKFFAFETFVFSELALFYSLLLYDILKIDIDNFS